jgi:hypothetical protein
MADEPIKPNGWNEWSRYVLKELEYLKISYKDLDGKMDIMSESFTGKLGNTSEKLTSKIDTLSEKLIGRIDDLSEKLTTKIDAVDRRVSKLNIRVVGISAVTTILTSLLLLLLTHLLKGKG